MSKPLHRTTALLLMVIALGGSPEAYANANGSGRSERMGLTLVRDSYILGPGDQLELRILDPGASTLNGPLEILNDGSAALALLGNVVLEGLSLTQATAWLQSLYSQYLQRPELNLRVVRQRPIQITVVGEVEKPGLYTLTQGESSSVAGASVQVSGLPTVVTAIQKAGGLTQTANITDVRLERFLTGGNNARKEMRLDLLKLLQKGDRRQNPFVMDGDTILVGKADVADEAVMELAAANLSPQTISVNIVGEVVKPGQVSLEANTPLNKAILSAGGPVKGRAKNDSVELVRVNRNGSVTHEFFKLDYSQPVNSMRNPPLRDGDTVIVNRTALAVASDGLDLVARPITSLVNVWALVDLIQRTTTD